jgi:NADH-quinone oxidoreductase subunit L
VLAFSTVSQIGYMFLALGIGAYGLAIFHLLVHACFKALLFMSSGVVIRVYKGDHDIRNMGGLARQQPWLHWCFFAGIITLAAVPLITASFYSKDDIIAAAWTAPQGILLWGLALLGAVLTGTYSFRLYLMVFAGRPRGETIDYRMPVAMKLPLAILAVLSIVIGFIQMPQGWPGPHWLLPWLEPLLGQVPEPDLTTAYWLQLVGAIASVLGIALAYPVVRRERQGGGLSNNQFLLNSWHMDSLYDFIIVRPYYALAAVCRIAVERFLLNGGVVGSVVGVLRTGHRLLSLSQNGQLSRYAGIMILGAALVLGYHLWLG